ncbi:MAG: hypothetical protein BGO69_07075 [Bacteroidetes bacterium 46-16]|nr:MAG: hypothetical protein BGO69_07075 [Bacteroidetes bacterium 46-16]
MGFFTRFKEWQFAKGRLEAFSDAVFAIVITLLVLELKIPEIEDATNMQEVWHAVVKELPAFYSWVISFFFIAIMWLHHHQIMHMATRSDYGAIWINTLLLFFVCLLPFPTSLMGHYHLPVFIMLWGITVSLTSGMLSWLYYYNAKNYLKESYDKRSVMKNVRLTFFVAPLMYLIAGFLAWVSVYLAFAIYGLVPFLYLLPLDKEKKHNLKNDVKD